MKKRHTLFSKAVVVCLMACLSSITAWADPIDVEQARQTAENFRKKPAKGGKHRAKLQSGELQYAFTQMTDNGAPAVYVFNTGNGFVLTSADDATTPILGYSDSGDFDPNNIPDGLKYLMGEYAKQIAALPANAKAAAAQYPYKVEYTPPVAPLLPTRWDQEAPYNNECPVALSANAHAATGCMTTAIAQIMRFHKWPTKGFGSHEMEAKVGNRTEHVERNYYNTTYNWDVMPLSKNNPTTEGANEVAKLMMDVAVALGTEFNSVSSAVHITVIPMLLSYFNYDPSAEMLFLKDMTTEKFNSILIGDLQAGRPVYFTGGPTNSGHAFVCDGYDGEGLFHINWGWSGKSDGYFLVNNLTPSEAGTGGQANAGYSQNLLMIHNIKPYQGGTLPRPEIKANYRREMQPGIEIKKSGADFYFGGNFGVYPQTTTQQRNIRARIGLYVEKPGSAGQVVWNEHREYSDYTEILRTNAYYNFRVKMNPSWAVEGTRVSYIYQESGASEWQYMKNILGDRCEFIFDLNSNGDLMATSGNLAYLIKEKAQTTPQNPVSVTYKIFLDNKEIGQKTVTEEAGKAPSKSFIPDYYVEATGFPTTISADNTTHNIYTTYKSTMPVVSGKAYNISFSVDGNTYLCVENNGQIKEARNPDPSVSKNQNTQWRFDGDWLNGFTIKSQSSNKYLIQPVMSGDEEENSIPMDVTASSWGDRAKYLLLHRNDGFYIKAKNSKHYMAHTQPISLEVYLYNQENYKGNIVKITEPGNLPQAEGIEYTVSISGQPNGTNPKVNYRSTSYGNGEKFTATGLNQYQVSATSIPGYSVSVTVGTKTVYATYSPIPSASVAYTVNICGEYPTDKTPALIYNGQQYTNNEKVTATDMTITQLAATSFDGYVYTIDIKSTTITVTYTKKVTYDIVFSGLPADASPVLYYMSQPVKSTQLTVGNLKLDQLSASNVPNYGYQIALDGTKIKVDYFGSSFYFLTNGSNSTTIKKSPVEVTYYGYNGKNNIFGDGQYCTVIKSTSLPIEKVEFHGTSYFTNIKASVGTLKSTIWTCPEGTNSVKFYVPVGVSADAFSTGLTVYLKLPDTSDVVLTDVNIYTDETGYSTFYFEGKYLKPSGLKVYYCKENEKGTLSAIEWTENYIPALTPLILEGQANSTYTFTRLRANEQDVNVEGNVLRGHTVAKSLVETKSETSAENIFVFSRVNGQFGFYKFAGETLQAHKAFYAPTNGANVQGFVLDFGGEQTTGIEFNDNGRECGNQSFDLAGRRVNANAKGISIINGKKVIR